MCFARSVKYRGSLLGLNLHLKTIFPETQLNIYILCIVYDMHEESQIYNLKVTGFVDQPKYAKNKNETDIHSQNNS